MRTFKFFSQRLPHVAVISIVMCGLVGMGATAASASAAPALAVSSTHEPGSLVPGGTSQYVITIKNIGDAATTEPVSVQFKLPTGLHATSVTDQFHKRIGLAAWNCTIAADAQSVGCTGPEVISPLAIAPGEAACETIGQAFGLPPCSIVVDVSAEAGLAPEALTSTVEACGGGATACASANASTGIRLPGFGIESFTNGFFNQDGSPDAQAGSHPWAIKTSFSLNSRLEGNGLTPDGDIKDLQVELPAGFVGNATIVPQCTSQQFLKEKLIHRGTAGSCPASTQVGVAEVDLGAGPEGVSPGHIAIYNLVPTPGVPAEFGFDIAKLVVLLTPKVRTGGNYGLTVEVKDVGQASSFVKATTTLWGIPSAAAHNSERGPAGECEDANVEECGTGLPEEPFLTMQSACSSGPLTTTIHADSWQEPGKFVTAQAETQNSAGEPVGVLGCNRLAFEPTLTAQPDTEQSDTPAGLTVDVKPSLGGLLDPNGVSSADIKNTRVTLPQGVVINPGQAAGLQACQPSQDALGRLANGEEDNGPPECPLASKVGMDEITTPLLPDKLEGDVYVLQSNPPNLQLLVSASADGVNVKLVGNVHLDETTGQLTTTFTETPQLPFSDFKLAFSGGAQAALVTPPTCGLYTTNADFTPWSAPFAGDALTSAGFDITGGPGGSGAAGCTGPLGFAPSLIAGATTDQAGGFTDFSLLLARGDGQQRISTLQFKTPKGLLGMISKISLCGEAQANTGTCPAASQIGHTVVEAGPGPYPLVVPQPGQPPAPIYLTGGYKGAPYGLSIVVPLVVGPFTLQTQVVRARIEVDPHTAQLTITTDPIPSIVDGIPTDLRTINAVIDRPGFIFNPTNCNETAFTGTASSTQGASAPLAYRFQVGSCQSLKFKPSFKVSTQARTSRLNGASLDAKILYPATPPGNNQATSQANIASVKVELPKRLPSRLKTLQQACTAATFESNPADCPRASVVGHATAVTPVLPVPLTGPAYFVSHGGEAFPSLVVVLQGYGTTVDLVGTTFINKQGITSSTFKQVPDVPVTSFDLSLPEGPFSALAAVLPAKAHGSLCNEKLTMPTVFTAQNGAVLKQTTKIAVTGCTKRKKASRHGKQPAVKQRKGK